MFSSNIISLPVCVCVLAGNCAVYITHTIHLIACVQSVNGHLKKKKKVDSGLHANLHSRLHKQDHAPSGVSVCRGKTEVPSFGYVNALGTKHVS